MLSTHFESSSPANTFSNADMGYGQLLAILIRRRFWPISAFLLSIPLAAALTLTTEPTYRSSMKFLVEPNYQEKQSSVRVDGELSSEFADSKIEIDYATQIHLMKESQLLHRAIDLLGTDFFLSGRRPLIVIENPEELKPDEVRDVIAGQLQKSLTIAQLQQSLTGGRTRDDETETKIFEVEYVANNSDQVQAVLQTLQSVYLDYNLEAQQQRLEKGLAFIDEQLPVIRADFIEAQSALERFRTTYNLIDPEQQALQVEETLNEVELEQQEIQGQYQAEQSVYQALQQQLGRSPDKTLMASRLSQSSRYQTLLDALQETELVLAEEQATLTDQNPRIKSLVEQRDKQRTLLQKEVKQILGADSAQFPLHEGFLIKEGQLGEIDLDLAAKLIESQNQLRSLEARAQNLAITEQQLRYRLSQFPQLIEKYNRLQPQVEVKRDRLEQLLKARQELSIEIAQGGFDWQVVEMPKLGEKIAPSLKTNLLLGAVVGLFVGGGVAFLREALDDTLHGLEQLKQLVNLPFLGSLPYLALEKPKKSRLNWFKRMNPLSVGMQKLDWPLFRESFDLIYKNIRLVNGVIDVQSLVVTSAIAGEGKTTVTLGLALSAARIGKRVLVVDGNFRHPSLHKLLDLPNETGLSAFLLTNDAPIPKPQQLSFSEGQIDVITAGAKLSDPIKLLSSAKLKELMATLEQEYDLILLDASHILGLADFVETVACSQGVLVVSRINHVGQSEVTEAMATLNPFNVLGIVANGSTNTMTNQPISANPFDVNIKSEHTNGNGNGTKTVAILTDSSARDRY